MAAPNPWTLFNATAGRFPPAAAAAVGVCGLASLIGVVWAVLNPNSMRPEFWVVARGWLFYSCFATLLNLSDRKLMSAADWPLLRLTGQDANLFRGLVGPPLLRAVFVHAATTPVGLLIGPRNGGLSATLFLEAASLAAGLGLSLGLLHLRLLTRTHKKWLQYGGWLVAAWFLYIAVRGVPPTAALSFVWRWTAIGLQTPAAFVAGCLAFAAAGYLFAEWRFGFADERAAHVPAVQFAPPATAVQPKAERPRTRRSRILRTARPVSELIVRHVRPGFLWTAGAASAVVLLAGYAVPPLAEAAGFPGVDILRGTLGFGVGLTALAYAFCAALTASMVAEMGLRERWLPDVLMAVETRDAVRQLMAGCFRSLMPLLAFAGFCGVLFLADGGETKAVLIGLAAAAGLTLGGFLLNLAAVSLTLRYPAMGLSQLWRMGVGFLLLPVALVYTPFHYRKTERVVEEEPGRLEVIK